MGPRLAAGAVGLVLVFHFTHFPTTHSLVGGLSLCIPHGALKGLGTQQVLSERSLVSPIPRLPQAAER